MSKTNIRRVSSGLPHSEISGSKGILTSPELIAEYHVLHRLLLPRHPPNALFALDLIQKKTVFCAWRAATRPVLPTQPPILPMTGIGVWVGRPRRLAQHLQPSQKFSRHTLAAKRSTHIAHSQRSNVCTLNQLRFMPCGKNAG